MGEERVREALIRGLEGSILDIPVLLVKLGRPLDAEYLVRSCMPNLKGVIVAGLPTSLEGARKRCALQTAYLYFVEDRMQGSRVRNDNILFLMNLLGYKQTRDVVEHVRDVDVVAILGVDKEIVRKAARFVAARCDGKIVEPEGCDPDYLLYMSSARIRRFLG